MWCAEESTLNVRLRLEGGVSGRTTGRKIVQSGDDRPSLIARSPLTRRVGRVMERRLNVRTATIPEDGVHARTAAAGVYARGQGISGEKFAWPTRTFARGPTRAMAGWDDDAGIYVVLMAREVVARWRISHLHQGASHIPTGQKSRCKDARAAPRRGRDAEGHEELTSC